jgi:RNA polymerase sigma factor (sigma-70 family)
MKTTDWPADDFQAHRTHLRGVAYRMLGSLSEADDAVQETWLRLSRAETSDVHNIRAWLTTVVSRVCLDMLRARAARREESLDVHVPDPIVTPDDGSAGDLGSGLATGDPEQHALLADSIGLALLVVLDTLSPAERLAFVLHDIFAVPFEQVGAVLDRSAGAAKQLASRARRRLRDATPSAVLPSAPADPVKHREVVAAFQSAAGEGDFAGLLAILDPDVVLRADAGDGDGPAGPSRLIRGPREVMAQAQRFAPLRRFAIPVLINGAPGFLVAPNGEPFALISVTVYHDKITEIDILADPRRLGRLDLSAVLPAGPGSLPG